MLSGFAKAIEQLFDPAFRFVFWRAIALSAVGLLTVSLLGSLILMSGAIQNSAKFGALFSVLLITNGVGLLTFVVLIGINIRRLVGQLRGETAG